ncbi:unnamed protein product [Urochloa humidicola]
MKFLGVLKWQHGQLNGMLNRLLFKLNAQLGMLK